MPSKSPAQHRFMEAAAHDPKFAARAGIAPSVAQEFVQADQGKFKGKAKGGGKERIAKAMIADTRKDYSNGWGNEGWGRPGDYVEKQNG